MGLLDRLRNWRPGRVAAPRARADEAQAEKRAAAAEAEARREANIGAAGGRGPGSRLSGGF
jgi:hypothetical protein